jgi:hypothetical protein
MTIGDIALAGGLIFIFIYNEAYPFYSDIVPLFEKF